MNPDRFSEIESDFYRENNNKRWGGYISLGVFIALLSDGYFRHIDPYSMIFEAMILGAALCFWAISYDRESKLKSKLDAACISLFGKRYKESSNEIIEMKYPKKN
ncbi:hypothetical protein ACUNG9_04735 [Serratia sp. IR-2025]|nr:hypothetical protein [Serratia marcescens]HBC0624436.1 hypothetical protein [Serratia marcescens]